MCILDNLNVSNVFVSKFVYIMGDGLILCINVVLSIVLVVVSIVNQLDIEVCIIMLECDYISVCRLVYYIIVLFVSLDIVLFIVSLYIGCFEIVFIDMRVMQIGLYLEINLFLYMIFVFFFVMQIIGFMFRLFINMYILGLIQSLVFVFVFLN